MSASTSSRSTPVPRARCRFCRRRRASPSRISRTEVILGRSLKEQGIFGIYPDEKARHYVKVPVFSSNKIKGLDAYLSPEMKSTGEAIGYDRSLLARHVQGAAGIGHEARRTTARSSSPWPTRTRRRPSRWCAASINMGFNIAATAGHGRLPQEKRHPHPRASASSPRAAARFST